MGDFELDLKGHSLEGNGRMERGSGGLHRFTRIISASLIRLNQPVLMNPHDHTRFLSALEAPHEHHVKDLDLLSLRAPGVGVKHFALWPLAHAAECFGTDEWPGNWFSTQVAHWDPGGLGFIPVSRLRSYWKWQNGWPDPLILSPADRSG